MALGKPRLILLVATVVLILSAVVALVVVRRAEHRAGEQARANTAAAPAPLVVYDPTKLLENGVQAGEVYDKEPRNEAWANAVEATLGKMFAELFAAIVPEARVAVKCKTLSCLVGVDAPPDKRAAALATTKFMMLAPWVVDLTPEDDGTQLWLFFEEPRFADPATFVDWLTGLRKRRLEEIRTEKTPNPFPVPLAQVPAP